MELMRKLYGAGFFPLRPNTVTSSPNETIIVEAPTPKKQYVKSFKDTCKSVGKLVISARTKRRLKHGKEKA